MIRQMDIFSMVKSAGKATDSISILNFWFPRLLDIKIPPEKVFYVNVFWGSKCLLTRCLDVQRLGKHEKNHKNARFFA